ncbi:energy transducer TonB [Undibacterium sp. LX40W]|uniref:Energy transducer TonB n=1 Tax=Undibacterium nitidum TaxID=2762298 RepID=A0A923KUK6_9BURK|nr:energy transducer TonB [Undibacterium nitidum]MBC3893678.1 energy transducer TonB [Undibacterium sp. LX40W]
MQIRILVASVVLAFSSLGNAVAAVNQPVMDNKSCEAPKYPKASLMNEETGTVTLGFLVSVDGKVVDSKIESTSGSKSLDKAALAALSLCKFKPGSKDGKVEQMWTKVDFVWKF